MSVEAYKDLVRDLELPELLVKADDVRETTDTPGWRLVQASIDFHTARLTAQLVHTSTRPEKVDYLRGQIEALGAMREAAEAIIGLAVDREAAAIKEHA